jgi:hypothetical protein
MNNRTRYIIFLVQIINSILYILKIYQEYQYFVIISFGLFFVTLLSQRIVIDNLRFIILNGLFLISYIPLLIIYDWDGSNPILQAYFLIILHFGFIFQPKYFGGYQDNS